MFRFIYLVVLFRLNFRFGFFVCGLSLHLLGIARFERFGWKLFLGIFRSGTFAGKLSVGDIHFGFFVWGFSFGTFVGFFALKQLLGA